MKLIVVFLLATLQIGCVAFPVTRTYFEPNLDDGKPARSSSCGYNRTAEDSLERFIDGLHVLISPSYREGHPVSVTFMFRYSSGDVDLHIDQFELHSTLDGSVYKPSKITRNLQRPDKSHPYYSIWVHLEYAVTSEKLEGIKLVFPAESIKRNGFNIDLAPFRFNKVTKPDIYYGSINC